MWLLPIENLLKQISYKKFIDTFEILTSFHQNSTDGQNEWKMFEVGISENI